MFTYIERSGSGSLSSSDTPKYAQNLEELEDAFHKWVSVHNKVGADPEYFAEFWVWNRHLDDVTDVYPDNEMVYRSGDAILEVA